LWYDEYNLKNYNIKWTINLNFIPVSKDFFEFIELCDLCSNYMKQLTDATNELISPNVLFQIQSGMSRTFSDNVGVLKKNIDKTKSETLSACADLLLSSNDIAKMFTLDPSFVDTYNKKIHGEISTEIYLSIISSYPNKVELINITKYALFDIPRDANSKEKLLFDINSLSHLHPLQVLRIGLFRNTEDRNDICNLTFPNAKNTTTYNLQALTDKTETTVVSGLSEKIVNDLKSIKLIPILQRSDVALIRKIDFPQETFNITTDNGTTVKQFTNPLTTMSKWCPFAGFQPFMYKYLEITNNIMLSEIEEDNKKGWNRDIKKDYELDIINENLISEIFLNTTLIDKIMEEFEIIYNNHPSKTIEELKSLIFSSSIVFSAVSNISSSNVIKFIHINSLSEYKQREIWVSQMNHCVDVSSLITSQISKNFIQSMFVELDKPLQVLSTFKRILIKSIEGNKFESFIPSLKKYVCAKIK